MFKKIIFIFFFYVPNLFGDLATASVVAGSSLMMNKDSFFSKWFPKELLPLKKVKFILNDDMNNHSAVKLQMVIVYKKDNDLKSQELLSRLQKMTSAEYFQQIDQLKKDYPKLTLILSWEFVPKKNISDFVPLKLKKTGYQIIGGVIFANYHSENGVHRTSIPEDSKSLTIDMQKNDFKINYSK